MTNSSARKAALVCLLAVPIVLGQTGATKAPATAPAKAAPKPATPVDKVVSMVKAGLGEDLVVKAIDKDNLKADLGAEDMVRLKQAGASDKVISAMMGLSPTGTNPAPPPPAPVAAAPPPPPPPPVPAAPVAPAAVQPPDPKAGLRTAAIDEFDWGTVQSTVQEVFHTNVDIGKGIRALLTTRVSQAGKIRIVERAKVQTGHEGAGFRRQQSRQERHRLAYRPDPRRRCLRDGRYRCLRPG